MSILIKNNMDMPKCCADCPFLFEEYEEYIKLANYECALDAFIMLNVDWHDEESSQIKELRAGRAAACPLVEVDDGYSN